MSAMMVNMVRAESVSVRANTTKLEESENTNPRSCHRILYVKITSYRLRECPRPIFFANSERVAA